MMGARGVAMRRVWRAVRLYDHYYMMAVLIVATGGIGVTLGNPEARTFDTGIGWYYFSLLRLGPLHPSEEQWGVAFFALAIAQYVSLWMLVTLDYHMSVQAVVHDRPDYTPHTFARVVWGLTSSAYFGIGASFFASNPVGIAAVLCLIPCAMSWRIMVRVRLRIEGAAGGGGGEAT